MNVVGYFRSELGVGEAARQVIAALSTAGVPALPLHGRTIPPNRQGHSFTYLDHTAARYPVNLICMNADALPEFAEQAGPAFFADRYSIGLWFWEVTKPPPHGWRASFQHLDEVWVPTHHVADAVAPVSPIPVTKITLPTELPQLTPVARAALGVPEGFVFLFSFDYLSVFRRKNPLAVVEAFKRAFEPGVGASLVLKCINGEHDPANHARLVTAIVEHPDIHLIDAYLSPSEKDALTAISDCYVSLHRSEGFGLTMAEAMYRGKPVIATGYSGNLDFMTDANSYLVDWELVPIGPGADPYSADGVWADPSVEHAARLMREVYDDPASSSARGERAAADIRRTHSAVTAGALMADRLRTVSVRRQMRSRSQRLVASLRTRIQRGPVAPAHSPLGALGPPLRGAVLRTIKPFTAYQSAINEEILATFEGVDELMATQAQQIDELRLEVEKLRGEGSSRTRHSQSTETETDTGRS